MSAATLSAEILRLRQLNSRLVEAASQAPDRDARWLFAMEGNRDGVWDWNAVSGEVYFSARWKAMLGYADAEIRPHVDEWSQRVHPDDRDRVWVDLRAHLDGKTDHYENEHRLLCRDGHYRWILDRGRIMSWTPEGAPLRIVGTHTDIHDRKTAELENGELIRKLEAALAEVRTLQGIIPICCCCKKLRDDKGYWSRIESFLRDNADVAITHSYCPECAERAIAELEG